MNRKQWICQLCLKPTTDYPNNAEPLIEKGKCCKECNNLVIMERLKGF